jgi:hypothetical protein
MEAKACCIKLFILLESRPLPGNASQPRGPCVPDKGESGPQSLLLFCFPLENGIRQDMF